MPITDPDLLAKKEAGKLIEVLDDGFIALVDVMGDDGAVVQAARVSYGKGTKTVSDDRGLIRYLMRHWHTTPFEMAEVKFLVRVPMDTWRQWIRHRTANVNEYSTRYSEAIDSAQTTPSDQWRKQSTGNKQGSGGFVDRDSWPEDFEFGENLPGYHLGTANPHPGEWLTYQEEQLQKHAREVYEERLRFGVAREQARKDLPLSTYTEAYWKCDLHNIFNFLRLRVDSHAQWEIRQYANAMLELIEPLFPLCVEAFRDYRLNAMALSGPEIEFLRKILVRQEVPVELADNLSKREQNELRAKLERLGVC